MELEQFQYDTRSYVLYLTIMHQLLQGKKNIKTIILIEQVWTYNNEIDYQFTGTTLMGSYHYFSFKNYFTEEKG